MGWRGGGVGGSRGWRVIDPESARRSRKALCSRRCPQVIHRLHGAHLTHLASLGSCDCPHVGRRTRALCATRPRCVHPRSGTGCANRHTLRVRDPSWQMVATEMAAEGWGLPSSPQRGDSCEPCNSLPPRRRLLGPLPPIVVTCWQRSHPRSPGLMATAGAGARAPDSPLSLVLRSSKRSRGTASPRRCTLSWR